jgi:teichuronic acid biosynthesis glycosyltransferase TuaC
LRVLVASNMRADADHPERGRFVRDQVEALRRLSGLDVELHEFPPGGGALAQAALQLYRSHGDRTKSVDVVHAHFGLTAWPALAARAHVRGLTVHGTDVRHPRTRLATGAVLPLMDLVAAPTPELADVLPGRRARQKAQVLPCGVDINRFHPIPRAEARAELGLNPHTPCLLFPADPARPGKRYDRARALACVVAGEGGKAGGAAAREGGKAGDAAARKDGVAGGAGTETAASAEEGGAEKGRTEKGGADVIPLHTLGGIPPERVPLWVNAANAVVVPSDAEGFGMAVLEALACDVPVLATPVGVHPQALAEVDGTLCAPFELERWRAAVAPHLADPDPRIAGRARAEQWSAPRMAERLAAAWRELLEHKLRGVERKLR